MWVKFMRISREWNEEQDFLWQRASRPLLHCILLILFSVLPFVQSFPFQLNPTINYQKTSVEEFMVSYWFKEKWPSPDHFNLCSVFCILFEILNFFFMVCDSGPIVYAKEPICLFQCLWRFVLWHYHVPVFRFLISWPLSFPYSCIHDPVTGCMVCWFTLIDQLPLLVLDMVFWFNATHICIHIVICTVDESKLPHLMNLHHNDG